LEQDMTEEKKSRQGFQNLPPEERRALGSKGGKIAHRDGTAYEWTGPQAKEAGRKGGLQTAANRKKKTG
jgi:uncharacterized protein